MAKLRNRDAQHPHTVRPHGSEWIHGDVGSGRRSGGTALLPSVPVIPASLCPASWLLGSVLPLPTGLLPAHCRRYCPKPAWQAVSHSPRDPRVLPRPAALGDEPSWSHAHGAHADQWCHAGCPCSVTIKWHKVLGTCTVSLLCHSMHCWDHAEYPCSIERCQHAVSGPCRLWLPYHGLLACKAFLC